MEDDQDLITTRAAANLLGVHVATVRRMALEGLLRTVRVTPRGPRLFIASEVEARRVPRYETDDKASA